MASSISNAKCCRTFAELELLQNSLLSARDMAQRTFIGQDRIVYSTDKDLYEQDYDAQQWEKRFREIEKSE
ncbi:hypothetical protein MTR67_018902 [Solanum verrucosum]|uniref:Uncharacterized protein n=1 Tax=Solanum verrucosum TaxID=315347 RepID=A0AAF0QMN1_SOLVR|nr:hypothetical protein MTR67_018902 [Solanum verrucosum]